MIDYLFTFRSLTAAQQAELLLIRYGIPCRLVRAPSRSSNNGCSYAVRVQDYYRTNAVFIQENLNYERVLQWNVGDWV